MFHERKFLEYHMDGKFDDASLFFLTKTKNASTIEAVFPAALLEKEGQKILFSHPGSSYGGLVLSPNLRTEKIAMIVEKIIDHAENLKVDSIEIRLPENLIYSAACDQEFSFLLWHRGFMLKTRELSSAVYLQPKSGLKKFLKKSYNWSVKKAQSENVQITLDLAVEDAYRLIKANLNGRYNKNPTHSIQELKDLKKRYPSRIKVWSALKDDCPIAAVVVFEANQNVVHDFYIAQDYDFAKFQPLYLIFDSIFKYYSEKGFCWFNFGISTRDKWIKWGILNFKEGLGGRGVIRETWALPSLEQPSQAAA